MSDTIEVFRTNEKIGVVSIGLVEFGEKTVTSYRFPTVYDNMKKAILRGNCIYGSSPHTKEAWEKAGGYSPTVFQDWDFWIKILWESYLVVPLFRPLYKYRRHDKSLSYLNSYIWQKDGEAVLNLAKVNKNKLQELEIYSGELAMALEREKYGKTTN